MDMMLSPNIWYCYDLAAGLLIAWQVFLSVLFVLLDLLLIPLIFLWDKFLARCLLGKGGSGRRK